MSGSTIFSRSLAAALLAGALCAARLRCAKRGGTLVIDRNDACLVPQHLSDHQVNGEDLRRLFGTDRHEAAALPRSPVHTGRQDCPLRRGVKFRRQGVYRPLRFTIMEVLKKILAAQHLQEVMRSRHDETSSAREAAPMMAALSGYESPMIPKHIYGSGDIRSHDSANKPVGTGPFKFVEWRRGELVRLDRNPDYWRSGQPYLDRIVVRFIPDSATRTALLEKGDAHVAGFGAVPYNDVKRLAALPNMEVTTKGGDPPA